MTNKYYVEKLYSTDAGDDDYCVIGPYEDTKVRICVTEGIEDAQMIADALNQTEANKGT